MKYKCSICGYLYDDSEQTIPFAELPDNWQCPWCGAPKSAFEPVKEESTESVTKNEVAKQETATVEVTSDMQKLSIGQMAALCSNLARGCEKQYMSKESELFTTLADWFTKHTPAINDATVESVASGLKADLKEYPVLNQTGAENSDRGAQRVCVWGEKVTRMLSVLMDRYSKEGDDMLNGKEIWVCSVCGFTYIGNEAPALCPVCKVPAWKFDKIERRIK